MAKVWCAEIECQYNQDGQCRAKEINIAAGHIHSKYQGFIHHWECRTFRLSKESEELFSELKTYFNRGERETTD